MSDYLDSLYTKSLSLVHRCQREKVSMSLLITVLNLIHQRLIKNRADLNKFLTMKARNYPIYDSQVEKVKEMIHDSFLL